MAIHILTAILGGLLLLGVSTAFAEDRQDLDQDMVQTQGKESMAVTLSSEAIPLEQTHGPQLLTDEELDKFNGGVAAIPTQPLIHMPEHAQTIFLNKFPLSPGM